ncbi:hypothetical protein [Paenibacillus polymyxa]|nr:hypothetical protein [Paenibacillus polymyxa]
MYSRRPTDLKLRQQSAAMWLVGVDVSADYPSLPISSDGPRSPGSDA